MMFPQIYKIQPRGINVIIPVILCGGSGTRLWPLSRTTYPKQLLSLIDGKSLLQRTLERVKHIPHLGQPIVICNQDYRFITAEQLHDIGFTNAQIILEPEGKNTAPAATLAALHLAAQHKDALLLILPADHVINDYEKFVAAVQQAAIVAQQGKLVTFGVVPTKPETGYGYIRKGQAVDSVAYQVQQFVEKPNRETAEDYIQSGNYFWNSGMFMFQITSYLREVEQHAPDILAACKRCIQEMNIDLDFYRIKADLFAECRNESLDYAIMEKSSNMAVVPLASDWSDVGSWNAMWDIHKVDYQGNAVKGDVMSYEINNCYLHAESRLVAAVGVSDIAVVETADAVLVTHKDRCQDVKMLVNSLKQNKRSEIEHHRRVYRPWGYYETLSNGPHFHVKHLVVKPSAKLSLQMHKQRSEHWIVIKGMATVTRGEEVFELHANQSTFIPVNTKHRLENVNDEPLEIIEVQTGNYFGEDDIVRFEDIYRREVDTVSTLTA